MTQDDPDHDGSPKPPEYAQDAGARLPEYRPLYRPPGPPPPPPPEPPGTGWDSLFTGAAVELGACAAAWAIVIPSGQHFDTALQLAIAVALLPIAVFLFSARRRALPASLIAFAIAVLAVPFTCAVVVSL